MNEQIVKLFVQSVDSNYIPVPVEDHIPSWTEKFAKLIVAEMLQTCEDHPAWTGRMIGEQIKQHFGLEESKGWVCPKCGIDRTKDICPNGHMAAIEGKCPMTMEAQ